MGFELQEEDFMKCVFCKKASTKPGTTTVTFESDCLTMVVKCVPVSNLPQWRGGVHQREGNVRAAQGCGRTGQNRAQVEIRQYVAA
jgi:hypothetical protein